MKKIQSLSSYILNWIPRPFRRKSILIRAFICWLIAFFVLLTDEQTSFDLRLQVRGTQKTNGNIVLLKLKKKPSSLSPQSWLKQINELQSMGVKKVVILAPQKLIRSFSSLQSHSNLSKSVLKNIFWIQSIEGEEKIPQDLTSFKDSLSISYIRWLPDPDLIIRRFQKNPLGLPNALQAITGHSPIETQLINFLGPKGTFPQLSNSPTQPLSPEKLKDKIVIMQSPYLQNPHLITPLGSMMKMEILANLIEASQHDRWIQRLPNYWYYLSLFIILIFGVLMIFKYPQTITFIFFIWISTSFIAFSAWVFDSFYIWTPILSPIILLISVFVIFTSFQLAIQEKNQWRMTQERQAQQEIELLKNNFLSLFSHDLKTPIAKIQAICDRLLMTQPPDGPLTSDLQSLRGSSDELFQYIQKILQISRVESRQVKLQKEAADLNDVIEKTILRVSPIARSKDIQIHKDLTPLFAVEMDVTLIEEVILNFLDNAIKYSPRQTEIQITTSETDEAVVFSISDQGPGIPIEDQPKVWRRFTRGKDQNDLAKGFGLGLYLARYFIELHGGQISLKSASGQGTTISFNLPFEQASSTILEASQGKNL